MSNLVFTQLSDVTAYENAKVIHRFRRNLNISEEDAKDIFIELMKWIWLCAKAQAIRENGESSLPVFLRIQSGMIVIDEMWHSFILHTRDYVEFCDRFFGKYIHHTPSRFDFVAPTEQETELQLRFISENLGGIEGLKKWYQEYDNKYSSQNLKSLFRVHNFGQPCSSQWDQNA